MRFAWLAVVALAPVACNSSSSPSAAQACADLAAALCAARDTCTNDVANARDYGSAGACEARLGSSCAAALAAPDTAATPEDREACAQAYGSGAETCLDYEEDAPVAACEAPAGPRSAGAPCVVAAQCASTYCAIAADAVCGTCQPPPGIGATCTVIDDCGGDLACAAPAGATSGTCAAWVAQGGSCLTGVDPCAPELACMGDDPTSATHGTCMPTVATVGAACDSARQAAAPCDGDRGLACIPSGADNTVGTCQAIALVGVGQTCGAIGGPPITNVAECAGGGMCVKVASTDRTGTCVGPAPDGAPCDSALGPPCLAPARCVPTSATATAGSCTLPYSSTCL